MSEWDKKRNEYDFDIFTRGKSYVPKNGQRKLFITELYFLT